MSDPVFDLTIRNGRIVTAGTVLQGDIGVRDGLVAAIGTGLAPGLRDIDAAGRWVLPGGIDSHCHVEQKSGMGMMCADDFYSATVAAAYGGTTTIVPFAAQHRGMAVPEVLADYSKLAAEKAVIDYGFHLILANPDEQTLKVDLPRAIREGITSLKVYMTYDRMKLEDHQLLDVLALSKEEGALVMVHAENHDMIKWIAQRLLDRGHGAPKFHGVAHDPLAETEAAFRAISMGRLVDVPLLIVHVAGAETVALIRQAQSLGANVLAESCPQYLFLTADDLDAPGLEGAKFCCSPPPRDEASQEAVWQGLIDGTLATYSSDHAPYRFDETGKLPKGEATLFKDMANGVPGIELRLPLLFSEGFMAGRIDIHQFVALASGNHARLYGMAPQKGEIAVGADADIAIWNPGREVVVSAGMLHDNTGYTPYEGRTVRGWPEVVLSRGRLVVDEQGLHAERGSGRFIRRGPPDVPRRAPPAGGRGSRPHGRVLKALIGLKDAGEKRPAVPVVQVLNPNSSVSVTEGVDRAVQAVKTASPVRFDSVTSKVGPAGIVSQEDYDVAAVQVAEHVALHAGEADAFVIACFSDPGVARAREVSGGRPVIGLGEAGVRAALRQGTRVGVVAVADASIPRHLRYWKALGVEAGVVGERALNLRVDQTGDPALAFEPMLAAARELREVDGADVILLGCAGMADLRGPLAAALGMPVIDPCEAAAMEAADRLGGRTA